MPVEASVDEADIGQIREGQNVNFTVVSYLVIIDVDNLDGKLLPSMTANVEIITGTKANALRVPTGAPRFRPKVADRGEPAKEKPGAPAKKDPPRPTLYVAGPTPTHQSRSRSGSACRATNIRRLRQASGQVTKSLSAPNR
jgi:HlyD family secretion protein